jgi:thioredoxin 1
MASEHVLDLTDQNFDREVLESGVPVVVDFWAPWCGPCRMLAPTVEELAREWAGKAKVGKLDVDENPTVAQRFRIQSIPTIMVFSGGKPIATLVGVRPKRDYAEVLARAAGRADRPLS